MSEVRTRDEALLAVGRALAQWVATATVVFTQANAVLRAAQSLAEQTVRRWLTEIAALEQLLRSLGPYDDPRPVERELAMARECLRTARRAEQQIAGVASRLAALQRAHARTAETVVDAARADLARRTGELGSYRAGARTGGSSSSAGHAGGVGGSGTAASLDGAGLTDVDIAAADFSGNPITGSFGRGGATRADYRWAVQTWDEVVGPGVARGMTRSRHVERVARESGLVTAVVAMRRRFSACRPGYTFEYDDAGWWIACRDGQRIRSAEASAVLIAEAKACRVSVDTLSGGQ